MNIIRSKVKNKNKQELTAVRMVQQISAHESPVWCASFNDDATLLATGGQDSTVKVWVVMGSEAAEEHAREHANDPRYLLGWGCFYSQSS